MPKKGKYEGRDERAEPGSHRDRFGENDAHFGDPSYLPQRVVDRGYHFAAHLSVDWDETWSLNTGVDSDSERESLAQDVEQCCSLSPPPDASTDTKPYSTNSTAAVPAQVCILSIFIK